MAASFILLANSAIDYTFGELNPMSKEDDYKLNAARTVDLAKRATTLADKGHLLDLAEKWLDLADRAQELRQLSERQKRRAARASSPAPQTRPRAARGRIRFVPHSRELLEGQPRRIRSLGARALASPKRFEAANRAAPIITLKL